jgi:hypothetical protein
MREIINLKEKLYKIKRPDRFRNPSGSIISALFPLLW